MRTHIHPSRIEWCEDAGLPCGILKVLEREAAHLTRRDGRARLVAQWGEEPSFIEDGRCEEHSGLTVLAIIDTA